MLNQIIVINKKRNWTSRDVVNKLIKILNNKKIGHTGTLDPIAEGVLVCLTGKYTKLVPLITNYDKEYIATIKLGIKTDTLDITGNVMEEEKVKKLSNEEINNVLQKFIGKSVQEVPNYSAVSINGKRLYQYARDNEDITLPKREIEVKEIELLNYDNDTITFKVLVSKGTYIRSLIQDICSSLNVIGVMSELVRTKQGIFTIDNSYSLDDIANNNYHSLLLQDVLSLEIREINNESLEKKVRNGNKIVDELNGYILYIKDKKEVALYYFENKLGKLIILF